MQGMSRVYGPNLKFIVFEVLIGPSWLAVPQAEEVAVRLGLEFVAYDRIPATLEAIDAHRALPSVQAVRNGMGNNHTREGDVLRTPIEVQTNNGERIMAKHKNTEFAETKTPRAVKAEKHVVLEAAKAIAEEWVTPRRLEHVIDHLASTGVLCLGLESTGAVIKEMLADVKKESSGEIVWTKDAERAVTRKAAGLFKQHVMGMIVE